MTIRCRFQPRYQCLTFASANAPIASCFHCDPTGGARLSVIVSRMQRPAPILVRLLSQPWRLACLGFLAWPVCLGMLVCSAHLHLPTELAVSLAIGIIFAGLACCLVAAHVRRASFLRELALVVVIIGTWACIGRLTFYLMESWLL